MQLSVPATDNSSSSQVSELRQVKDKEYHGDGEAVVIMVTSFLSGLPRESTWLRTRSIYSPGFHLGDPTQFVGRVLRVISTNSLSATAAAADGAHAVLHLGVMFDAISTVGSQTFPLPRSPIATSRWASTRPASETHVKENTCEFPDGKPTPS